MKSRVLLAVAALAILAGVGWLTWTGEASQPPAGPPEISTVPEPEEAAPAEPAVVVKTVRGKVEAERDGEWFPTVAGDLLAADQAIRTGRGAQATLNVGGEEISVIVREQSEVSIREVTEKIARVHLERGRLGASTRGKLKLVVDAKGSSTVAEIERGQFSVFSNGKGMVAIAAESAEVKLRTPQGEQILAVGQQAIVTQDGPPTIAPIPEAVFLSVVWPEERLTRAESVTVAGKTSRGSTVRVNGREVAVGPQGVFTAVVPLAEGKRPILVEATDVMGRSKRARRTLEVRRKGPKVRANSDALWK